MMRTAKARPDPIDTKLASKSEHSLPLVSLSPKTERALRKSCSQMFEKPRSKSISPPEEPVPAISDAYKQGHQRSYTTQTRSYTLTAKTPTSACAPRTANPDLGPSDVPRRARSKTNDSTKSAPRTLEIENIPPPSIPLQYTKPEVARQVNIGEARKSRMPLEPLRQLSIPGPETHIVGMRSPASANRISRAGIIARPTLVDVSVSPSTASPISRPKTSGGVRTSTYNWLEEEFKKEDLDREISKLDLLERPRTAHADHRKSTYSMAPSAKSLPLEMAARDLPPLPSISGPKPIGKRSKTAMDVTEFETLPPKSSKGKMSFSFWKAIKFGRSKKHAMSDLTTVS